MKLGILLLIYIALTLTSSAQADEATNTVCITTNILLSLHKSGIPQAQSEFNSDEEIIWGLVGTSTNNIWYRHFPFGNFDMHLFDDHGREVPKTDRGLAFTAMPPLPTTENLLLKKFPGYAVNNAQGEFRQLFQTSDVFAITNVGTYELEIRMRLCVIMTNSAPDSAAMLDARNVSSEGLKYIGNFGILPSPALRVKIIKR